MASTGSRLHRRRASANNHSLWRTDRASPPRPSPCSGHSSRHVRRGSGCSAIPTPWRSCVRRCACSPPPRACRSCGGLRSVSTTPWQARAPGPRRSRARERSTTRSPTRWRAAGSACSWVPGSTRGPIASPALAGCAVFEVDHPATQAAKRAVVHRLELRRGRLTYVPVDFEVDDLASALRGRASTPRCLPCSCGRASPTTSPARRWRPRWTPSTISPPRGRALVLTYVDRRALVGAQPVPRGPALGAGGRQGRGSRGRSACCPRKRRSSSPSAASGCASTPRPTTRAGSGSTGRRERGSRLYRIAVTDVVGAPAAR